MPDRTLDRLLERHGRTFADELGIRLADRPEPLFQLLVGALLMSARIGTGIAVDAGRALFDRGYTTPQAMAAASWQDRVDALGEGHYVRYDESTSTYLGETSELLLAEYDGDLRQLRARCAQDRDRMRGALKECKGIGDVGVDIFFREVQAVWGELYPFADDAALAPARELALGSDAEDLADLVPRSDLPRLLAALVRVERADDLQVVAGDEEPGGLTDTQLETMSRDELYELAQECEVPGRSDMTKDELREALRSA
jgi:hypothetical protein